MEFVCIIVVQDCLIRYPGQDHTGTRRIWCNYCDQISCLYNYTLGVSVSNSTKIWALSGVCKYQAAQDIFMSKRIWGSKKSLAQKNLVQKELLGQTNWDLKTHGSNNFGYKILLSKRNLFFSVLKIFGPTKNFQPENFLFHEDILVRKISESKIFFGKTKSGQMKILGT